jgi:hypothetical protein
MLQRNSVVPGPQPRLHLPYQKWPLADRQLWQQAFGEHDPFSELHLSKATQDNCMWSYRRFLGFLRNKEPEALDIPPVKRLTIERAKLLVAHLCESNAPNSVVAAIEGLYIAARALMPAQDWEWLKTIKARLLAAVPARSRNGPVITSVQLLELGLKLMKEHKTEPGAAWNVRKAIAYRDGFISALVAFVPLRPKNLFSLQIGRHIIMEGNRWFILVPREETKTHKPIQFEVPELLVPYLDAYPIQSPYVSIANKNAEIMIRVGAEFGFTPASRMRLPGPTDPLLLEFRDIKELAAELKPFEP